MPTSGYISKGFDPRHVRRILKESKILLKNVKYDAIAVRGVSGMLFGPLLAYLLKKELIVVRKPKTTEDSHAVYQAESRIDEGIYIIVDDLMATGHTISSIVKEINARYPKLKPHRDVLLWHQDHVRLTEIPARHLKV